VAGAHADERRFVAGGLAVVNHLWLLFWVCLGVTVLSVPAGKLAGIMNDTVLAGDPSLQAGQGGQVAGTPARS
jgi:hypothetical protein